MAFCAQRRHIIRLARQSVIGLETNKPRTRAGMGDIVIIIDAYCYYFDFYLFFVIKSIILRRREILSSRLDDLFRPHRCLSPLTGCCVLQRSAI